MADYDYFVHQDYYVTRDNTKITPDQITIAGSVTRQQHKLSQCVVAKIVANWSWDNFVTIFGDHVTESTVEKGLRAHDIFLERIIPSPSRTPVLEFRVKNQDHLYSLAEKVANKSLANLVLDYMIPKDERRHTDDLVLSFHTESHYHELEEKLEQIQRNSAESYNIYTTSRRVDVEEDVPTSPKKRKVTHGKENAVMKNMEAGVHGKGPRSALEDCSNLQ